MPLSPNQKSQKKETSKKISRRRFLRYALEAGLTVGLIGSIHSLSRGGEYVRPPGSLSPDDFTSRCMRCSICVEVCPTRAIRLQDLTWDFENISTPVVDPSFGGCIHWQKECLRCADACPTGAIDKNRVKRGYKMGRVWLKPEACVNCMVCFDRCPVEGAVLFPNPNGAPFTRTRDIPVGLRLVDSAHKPYINPIKCTGCGLCVHYCPQKIMYLEPLGSST